MPFKNLFVYMLQGVCTPNSLEKTYHNVDKILIKNASGPENLITQTFEITIKNHSSWSLHEKKNQERHG